MHIPFCESICHYCDFVKRVPKNEQMMDEYLNHLVEEIKSYQDHFKTIDTIYIGGGTPSMLSVKQLTVLLDAMKEIHPNEYTIEVNPESYTEDKGALFKHYGINRISLGVQTFNQELLHYLNRKHTTDHVLSVIDHLKKIGIPRLSIDLIYAIPGQTMEMLDHDLKMIEQLNITHVSCYSLILEEKTYFYHQYLKGNFHQMDEDMEAMMYERVMNTLKAQGFEHYEISNYAKNGHQSMHNNLYWTLSEYIGVGLGAHGYIDRYRTYNHRHLQDYFRTWMERKEYQTEDMLLQDDLIFGLRRIDGVDMAYIEDRYHLSLFEKYPQLNDKMNLGLIEIKEGRLKLTQQGLFLGNQVFMVFI
ncbi:MAG TPA: radical SAM family heme chaperone HemW [Acholeplasmataceae bacterium]|nr:radical SAM family heme chaperone HemW [Acholeplasmataceae bacterium]